MLWFKMAALTDVCPLGPWALFILTVDSIIVNYICDIWFNLVGDSAIEISKYQDIASVTKTSHFDFRIIKGYLRT